MNKGIPSANSNSRLTIGIIILFIGIIYLLKPLIPYEVRVYLFSWQVILAAIGIIMGFTSKFKGNRWWIITLIGLYFFMIKFFKELEFYTWFKHIQFPILLIIVGCFFIYRARNKRPKTYNDVNDSNDVAHTYNINSASPILPNDLFDDHDDEGQNNQQTHHQHSHYQNNNSNNDTYTYDDENFNINAIFGTNRKIIKSKNYQGSNINSVFGNIYIDAVETEFDGVIYIDILNLFGSVDLVLPANYEVRNDLVPILGSVNDRRNLLRHNPTNTENKKYIVLKGTVLFGNVDIKS